MARGTLLRLFALLLAVLLAAACAGKEPRRAAGVMDTPEHHYRTGMYFLDQKEPIQAMDAFNRALELNPEYGPALAGKGLAKAMLGGEEALDDVRKGQRRAETPEEELRALIARIRALTSLAARDELEARKLVRQSEATFDDAVELIADNPRLETGELYYYQGEVYLQALELERAEELYRRVLEVRRGYEEQARNRWEQVQKVRRAAPETHLGLRIALVERITRADMAALLVDELGFQHFFSRTQQAADSAFRPPAPQDASWRDQSGRERRAGERLPLVDVAGHPLAQAVDLVTRYGIRGLQAYPDNTFRPDGELSRAEVAMILEDVLVRATNNPGLATSFIGRESPFPDLRADHPAFNAAMLLTTRGLLEASVRSGGFAPQDPVTGVDALLAVKRLKQELRVF